MTDAEKIAHAWRATLDWREPNVRLVLADLAAACHVAETTHVDGDPLSSARNEGKRAAFLFIAGRIGLPIIPEA